MTSDVVDGSTTTTTTDKNVFRRYGAVMLITLTLILTNIAAFTNFSAYGASTVYFNRTIDSHLTKERITAALRSEHDESLFHFIDVKDYNCRRNDSLLNYVILRGHVSPSSPVLTSQPRLLLAKDLTIKFCPNFTHHVNATYAISFLFSSGCNDDVIEVCRLDSQCNVKLNRHLPLCQLCNADITLEWRSFLKIQDAANRTILITLFKSQSILK